MGRKKPSESKNKIEELSFIETKLKDLKISKENRDINILLLGETGVGKSTFINAFFNYITYSSLFKARDTDLQVLIPSSFTITDENYEERTVVVGKDNNENVEVGESATQSCRSYALVKEGGLKIRLIDTPGVGDTRGIEQDNINFENILSFIGELKQLNAICILLKPNNSRLTVMFEFCIKQLLSKLEKSASQNLIFVFTNTRSTFYRPGETLPPLKKLLGTIEGVEIPCGKPNIFCTDNESFRFLAALKDGVNFSKSDVYNFSQSWKQSAEECLRMLCYIIGNDDKIGLVPHEVKNTISINQARRLIVQLSKPLAEIAQLIQDNIRAIDTHQDTLKMTDLSLSQLRENLYIPIIDLEVIELSQPTTVCTSPTCCDVYPVGDKKKWHYKERCHNPCWLKNVEREIIGSPELISCGVMNENGECKRCSCRYQTHMHIYYETKTFETKLIDKAVNNTIMSKKAAYQAAEDLTERMSIRISQFRKEKDFIIKTIAKFACFLKTNAIAPYNDAYKAYLAYLIDRENSMNEAADSELKKQLENMLLQYTEEKDIIMNAIVQADSSVSVISADDIMDGIKSLYSLQHYGDKIKRLLQAQSSAREDENKSQARELVFNIVDRIKKFVCNTFQKLSHSGPGQRQSHIASGCASPYSNSQQSEDEIDSDSSNPSSNQSQDSGQNHYRNNSRQVHYEGGGGHYRASNHYANKPRNRSFNNFESGRNHAQNGLRQTNQNQFRPWSSDHCEPGPGYSQTENTYLNQFQYSLYSGQRLRQYQSERGSKNSYQNEHRPRHSHESQNWRQLESGCSNEYQNKAWIMYFQYSEPEQSQYQSERGSRNSFQNKPRNSEIESGYPNHYPNASQNWRQSESGSSNAYQIPSRRRSSQYSEPEQSQYQSERGSKNSYQNEPRPRHSQVESGYENHHPNASQNWRQSESGSSNAYQIPSRRKSFQYSEPEQSQYQSERGSRNTYQNKPRQGSSNHFE